MPRSHGIVPPQGSQLPPPFGGGTSHTGVGKFVKTTFEYWNMKRGSLLQTLIPPPGVWQSALVVHFFPVVMSGLPPGPASSVPASRPPELEPMIAPSG